MHLVLAFPSGRLSNRFDRVFVGVVYATALLTSAAFLFFWNPDFGPECVDCVVNTFMVVPNNEIADVISRTTSAGVPILVAITLWRLWHRWRTATPSGRRALVPVMVAVPFAAVITTLWYLAVTIERDEIRVFLLNPIFQIPYILIPAGFLLGILRSRLARGSVADLAMELGRGVSLGNLRAVMARTLRDPSLELAFQAPSGSGFVDGSGQPIDLPPPGSTDRAVTRVEREGATVAVLIHDPGLDAETPGLVGAAGSVAALALENERLSAQVRAQLDEVRASRTRIVEAGDAERQRIERDLHDGAQQRLVALALRLQTARATTTGANELLDQATAELQGRGGRSPRHRAWAAPDDPHRARSRRRTGGVGRAIGDADPARRPRRPTSLQRRGCCVFRGRRGADEPRPLLDGHPGLSDGHRLTSIGS